MNKKNTGVIAICITLLILPQLFYYYLFQRPFSNDFDTQLKLLTRFLYYVHEGFIPLWSPFQHAGMPTAYNHAMSGALSPLNWVYLFFPQTFEGRIYELMLIHKGIILGLSSLFTFLYFRKISASTWPSVFGTVTFIYSFRMLDNFRYSTSLEPLCYLPILMWLLEKIISKEGKQYSCLFSISLGLMLLSGQPQHSIYNLLFIGLFILFRVSNPDVQHRWKLFSRLAIFGLLGLLLSAPFLWPFLRDALPVLHERTVGAVTWSDQYRLNNFSLMSNFGFPLFADVHSAFYSSLAAWIIFISGALLMFRNTFISPSSKRYVLFFTFIFLITILYSLGSSTPVASFINDMIPPLRFTRSLGRFLGVGSFCFSAVVVFALNTILTTVQQTNGRKHFAKVFVFTIAVSLTFIMLYLYKFHDSIHRIASPYSPLNLIPYADIQVLQYWGLGIFGFSTVLLIGGLAFGRQRLWLCIGGLLILLVLVEQSVYQKYGTWYSKGHRLAEFSLENFKALDSFNHRIAVLSPLGTRSPLLRVDGILVPHFDAPQTISTFLLDGGPIAARLYTLLDGPILFFTSNYSVVPDLKNAFRELGRFGGNLRTITYIAEKDAHELPAFKSPGIQSDVPVRYHILEYTPNRIRFTIDTPEDGIVNYLDNYHPNFKAMVDNKPAALIKTYGAFKGVWVPSGRHEVLINYDATSFKLALMICFASLIVLIWLWIFYQFKKMHWLVHLLIATMLITVLSFSYRTIVKHIQKGGVLHYPIVHTKPQIVPSAS